MLVFYFLCSPATGQMVSLTDDNSSVTIDTASDTGQSNWITDGTNNLFQQWFWYRIGDTAEASIDTIATPFVNVLDINANGDDETLYLRYENTALKVELSISLAGGATGSGVSDLSEVITITNLGDSTMDFHFFQYVDFDLGMYALDDSVTLVNANTFVQTDGGAAWISETADAPAADRYEASTHYVVDPTLTKLNNDVADVLNNNSSAGVGDVTWAFEWDFGLAPDDSFIISKDKHIAIPEPATLGLLGLGVLLLRRKK